MKKDITYVSQDALVAVAQAKGLPVQEQKGWLKVTCAPGRLAYVARTKRVGRVNLSGFEFERGTVDLGGESFGTVKQILDMARPEAEILTAFAEILDHASRLPAREKEKRTMQPKARAKAPRSASKADRLALIIRVAKEKGAEVSEEVIEALSAPELDGEEVDLDVAEEAGLPVAE